MSLSRSTISTALVLILAAPLAGQTLLPLAAQLDSRSASLLVPEHDLRTHPDATFAVASLATSDAPIGSRMCRTSLHRVWLYGHGLCRHGLCRRWSMRSL